MESPIPTPEQLLYKPAYPLDTDPALREAAEAFAEPYKRFLDAAKTEREAAAVAERLLLENGYRPFDPAAHYEPGDKVYRIHRKKCVLAATIGARPLNDGLHLNIAHIDCPRLDLKPNPLYEKDHLAFFKTHYYGGVRKYQWTALPLALHGVFCRPNGETVPVCVGEDEGDPVFFITDLLPHLSREQNERKLPDGVRGEELNLVVGASAMPDAPAEDALKYSVLRLLHAKYDVTERDLSSAELEVVPAGKARDVGFDRALICAYGQDDRSDAYPALMAEIGTEKPAFTTLLVLTDKEEIGSQGVTGMNSPYAFHFLRQLCSCQGADYITACEASKCLSSDVTAAYDPTWSSAFEPGNSTYVGRGVGISKYTGSGGKGLSNDASAELVAYLTGILDEAGVAWQIGELGRVDIGGGGTIAKFVGNQGIETIDVGVPVLSMHAPYELIHKSDLYMAYRAFSAFNAAQR